MQHNFEPVTIGIDISKDKLDIWLAPDNDHIVIPNNLRSIGKWLKSVLKKRTVDHMLFEPTGGYEKPLIQVLLKHEINPTIIHPNRLHYYAKSLGRQEKTDKLDSENMANFALAFPDLPIIKNDYISNKKLSELSSRRAQLKEMMHAEKCREAYDFFQKGIKASHKHILNVLTKELEKINQVIDEAIMLDTFKKQLIDLFQTMKGVGPVTASSLIVDVPELGLLNRAQIAKLIGVAPIVRESGKKNGVRHIYGGRGHVRKILFMAATVAVRHNPQMKKIHKELMERGKPYKVALVAVMRRMLIILNAMASEITAYRPSTN